MNVWLTAQQVKDKYGFDPTPYDERVVSGGLFICNTLDSHLRRLYLETDVIHTAHALRKKPAHPRTVREKILAEIEEQLSSM